MVIRAGLAERLSGPAREQDFAERQNPGRLATH
jgi:hypothetical protein